MLRKRLARTGVIDADSLQQLPDGAPVCVVGLVVTRQRPQTASGVTFVTLEDEVGQVNVVVWRQVGERCYRALVQSRLMEVRGQLQRESGVTHVIAGTLLDRSPWLGNLEMQVHEFH
jgi:error-prone DNA polymerase